MIYLLFLNHKNTPVEPIPSKNNRSITSIRYIYKEAINNIEAFYIGKIKQFFLLILLLLFVIIMNPCKLERLSKFSLALWSLNFQRVI